MTIVTRRIVLDTLVTAVAAAALERAPFAAGQGSPDSHRRILVFDVNETLLDVGALRPQFQRLFGDAGVAQEWFTNVILFSQVATIAGPYADFGAIARAVLNMTASAHGLSLSQA